MPGLEIIRPKAADPTGLTADRRLYLTADGGRVVEEGDPASAFLLASEGSVIPHAQCQSLGLSVVGGRVVQGASVGDEPATEKPAEDPQPIVPSVAPSAPAPKPKAKGKAKGGE